MKVNSIQLLSLTLALVLSILLGLYVPPAIDDFNDKMFANITILDEPLLVKSLQDVQRDGVLLSLHGWKHENYSLLTPTQIRTNIYAGFDVFQKAGIGVPYSFISPYVSFRTLSQSSQDAINSTGITNMARLETIMPHKFGEYGENWRSVSDYNDSQIPLLRERLRRDQPNTILIHVIDWNPFLKQEISEYLRETNQTNITFRVDDIEVNTPVAKVYDMAQLSHYPSVGRVVYGVIPSGTWRGGGATIFGIDVNKIFRVYWLFYLITAFLPLSFFVFWRFALREKKKDKELLSNPNAGYDGLVSIIIPAFNEEMNLRKCLTAIQVQDFKGEKEVLLINDGSSDKTKEIASEYPITIIDLKDNVGKANALNVGIKEAKGDILIFSDSDSYMGSTAVSTILRYFEKHPHVDSVAGKVLIDEGAKEFNIFKIFQAIEYHIEQEISRYIQSRSCGVLVCPGPLFAVRRSVIEKVQFNDTSIIEDADFTIRALKQGIKIAQEPDALVYTEAPKSLLNWFNQRKRWWYGNLQLWNMHKPWAKCNSWMILNYSGYLFNTLSLMLLLVLPLLILTYDDLSRILIRGMAYLLLPMILSSLFMAYFFINEKKFLIMLPLYALVYSTLKMFVISYLYLLYLSGRGVKVKFGSRLRQVV
jgi:cellulose synthase/poly-beta-1,6-N-acetylglucosamine synthase-like glycosyltransferase